MKIILSFVVVMLVSSVGWSQSTVYGYLDSQKTLSKVFGETAANECGLVAADPKSSTYISQDSFGQVYFTQTSQLIKVEKLDDRNDCHFTKAIYRICVVDQMGWSTAGKIEEIYRKCIDPR